MDGYWNHNTAYHPRILDLAHGRRQVLDVGAGDGLLLQRLSPLVGTATGIEPHPATLARARSRLANATNVTLEAMDFLSFDPALRPFDLITFVATIHHMDLEAALAKARDLLRPGGDLFIVGLAANRSPVDWAVSALTLPVVRFASLVHRETRDVGVPVARPSLGLREIRETAERLLPGVEVRRGLYYRYLLRWTKPATEGGERGDSRF
ncbi:class I SAM-dependent methyltransferase [Microbacterium sp.]|uniref:class I SAM-dependent methyltransferase n=1 Tax=Microbacterium sp. TaxID=51671 RepID=UPI0028112484|nr:class I SAM-dependent methyltransferase [Microbacterium sp.]